MIIINKLYGHCLSNEFIANYIASYLLVVKAQTHVASSETRGNEILTYSSVVAWAECGVTGSRVLYQHNFEHNRSLKSLSIMPAYGS